MANGRGKRGSSDRLYFLGLLEKTTVDGDFSHEIKPCPYHLLLGRRTMTNLWQWVLKNKDNTLLTNIHIVKIMVFPVVMYGCERWATKKAEHRRIDAFEL